MSTVFFQSLYGFNSEHDARGGSKDNRLSIPLWVQLIDFVKRFLIFIDSFNPFMGSTHGNNPLARRG
nr:hypothetical protein [Sulfuracidifex tepidarius]